ncbi:MAG: TRAP transporter TatT component family protein [Gammaproteobacteria bacterium]|nr:TRAP transporter TatT component family protein [Gammaproteobacteria bacterium]
MRERIFMLLLPLVTLLGSGCASLVSGATDNLSRAILNHDDPGVVQDAAPAYLVLVDSFITGDPDDEDSLRVGASLYAAYTGIFITDTERAMRLSDRSYDYARRALCEYEDELCGLDKMAFPELTRRLAERDDEDDLPFLGTLAQSWLVWIRAHSTDWSAVADLPRVEELLKTVLRIDETWEQGTAHQYMGMLLTVRPPALGGKPEEARKHFERAIDMSGGTNLGAKVAMAESYARLVFDRELHDRLLNDVLEADVNAEGQTLLNVMAKQQARELLASADDYF